MTLTDLIKQFSDGPISFHKVYVDVTGSITAALMLSQAMYWTARTKDGWFYKSQQDWQKETGMSRREQDSARLRLKQLGFWIEELRGVPATMHFKIDIDVLLSSLHESAKLVCTKAPNKIGGNSQTLTETTQRLRTDLSSSADDESKSLFPDSSSQEEKRATVKAKREKKGPDPDHAAAKAFWMQEFPLLGWDATSGKKINDMLAHCRRVATAELQARGGTIPLSDGVGLGWLKEVVLYAKKTGHWAAGKPIATFASQLGSIMHEMKHGKQKSNSEYYNRLNSADRLLDIPYQDF